MRHVAAIDISGSQAVIVTSEITSPKNIRILGVHQLPLPELSAGRTASADQTGLSPQTPQPEATADDLSAVLGLEIDSMSAVLSGAQVLFHHFALPFKEEKRLEQVVPLQVQDLVPFDIENFLIDPVVLGSKDGSNYRILAGVVPRDEISSALSRLKWIGANPRNLTVRASALSGLKMILPDWIPDDAGLACLGAESCSLLVYVHGELRHIREIPLRSSDADNSALIAQIKSSFAKISRESGVNLEKLVLIDSPAALHAAAKSAGLHVQSLKCSDFIEGAPEPDGMKGGTAWAVGLFAREALHESKTLFKLAGRGSAEAPLVDFRQGEFAYKTAWASIAQALQDELFYIILAVVLALGLIGTEIYTSQRALEKVEDKIADSVRQELPGVPIARRRELEEIKRRVAELEDKLSGIGSLSSLSPLDSLRELSTAIGPGIDIRVDVLSIGHSGLNMRGSVPDNPSMGRLYTALEGISGNRFCQVKVDSKGTAPGTNRVNFSADVEFCK